MIEYIVVLAIFINGNYVETVSSKNFIYETMDECEFKGIPQVELNFNNYSKNIIEKEMPGATLSAKISCSDRIL